jgi:hypothetical protein
MIGHAKPSPVIVGIVEKHSRSYGGWKMVSAESIYLLFQD